MSVQEICRVAENTQLGDGLFLMVLHAPKITELAQCGQFVHIACGEGHLLRRPISICAWKAPELRIVFQVKGEGTKWLSERRTGDELDVLGPLGHGFDVGALGSAPVFIGGGIGGMECALVLKQRGHTPVIFEKTNELGGLYITASAMSFKEADKALLRWYERELKKNDIEVRFHMEINAPATCLLYTSDAADEL